MKYFLLVLMGVSTTGWADSTRRLNVEIDPIAPTSAIHENTNYDYTSTKWGVNVDFNATNNISTGPELWIGKFNFAGPDSTDDHVRREDFIHGEKQKIESMRFRWNVQYWEHALSMSGYYIKGGYSYTDIISRAKRTIERSGSEGDGSAYGRFFSEANDDTDVISDTRHGIVLGVGERWLWAKDRVSLTVGASFTTNFDRTVTHEGDDPDAREDYDALIEGVPESKLSVRPYPEANVTFGISI